MTICRLRLRHRLTRTRKGVSSSEFVMIASGVVLAVAVGAKFIGAKTDGSLESLVDALSRTGETSGKDDTGYTWPTGGGRRNRGD